MEKVETSCGKLHICATPIGNLEDITLRILRVLREVDYIVAEDTRHTLKLLNHYEISKPLLSYHEHSPRQREEEILNLVQQGNDVALVSDSGMPGISDPGEGLVRLAHKRGIPVTVLPGPSAGLSALVLSGFSAGRFVFEGFLPRDKKGRQKSLQDLKGQERTIILHEAPHHLIGTLKDLFDVVGNRKIALVRELTKIYEEIIITHIEDALSHFRQNAPRGEFVLIVEGAGRGEEGMDYSGISVEEHIKKYMEAGLDKKEAIRQVAKDRNMPRNQVYKHSIYL